MNEKKVHFPSSSYMHGFNTEYTQNKKNSYRFHFIIMILLHSVCVCVLNESYRSKKNPWANHHHHHHMNGGDGVGGSSKE